MAKTFLAVLFAFIAVNSFANECEGLVKKIYECGERAEYGVQTICDNGYSFADARGEDVNDLAVDTSVHDENILRCDFSYPVSYEERCYGEIVKTDSKIELLSYKCFDLKTGKKIYTSTNN